LAAAALAALLLALPAAAQESGPEAGPEPADAVITLVGLDYPDYEEVVGQVRLPGVTPDLIEETDPQYLRLSLADTEQVSFLPERLTVYQTVSTGVDMPVSVNLVVDPEKNAYCFNPDIPYCTGFERLNGWFKQAGLKITDQEEGATLARFVVELGMSIVHHPDDFMFFRLRQKFGVEYWLFLRDIEQIYEKHHSPYRSEDEREEYERITTRYRDRVRPATVEEVEDGYRLHGFTYKMMKAAGDLREWDVTVHRDGTVDVQMETLERGIGEVSWSWAP
jgi:hypothetical protein